MSEFAQNCLLKTLEEPPPDVTIILVCEQPEQLLPTTLSRCCMVRFGPLPRDFVVRGLCRLEVAAAEAEFWAAFTDGSIGRSISLSRQGLYAIKTDFVQRLGALTHAGDVELGEYFVKTGDKLADAAVRKTRQETGGELSDMLAKRRAAGIMLELIAAAYRDALHLVCAAAQEPPAAAAPLVNADQRSVIEAIAARFDASQLAEIIEHLSEYESLLWRNVNPKTVWDNAVISCASACPLHLG
jgi:DNA polymerase-3 subunit delta'